MRYPQPSWNVQATPGPTDYSYTANVPPVAIGPMLRAADDLADEKARAAEIAAGAIGAGLLAFALHGRGRGWSALGAALGGAAATFITGVIFAQKQP